MQVENAYHRTVTAAGSGALLRRAYVDNAGHWPDIDATALNNRAAAVDSTTPARYIAYQPGPCPRPYDLAHPADRP